MFCRRCYDILNVVQNYIVAINNLMFTFVLHSIGEWFKSGADLGFSRAEGVFSKKN